jgi:hypothetical protein
VTLVTSAGMRPLEERIRGKSIQLPAAADKAVIRPISMVCNL